jgi:anti-sigma regulatory factor (Ser/Thr protein kinase)
MGRSVRSECMRMKYEASIPAQVAAISPVVDEVLARIREENAHSGRIEFAIETALREALANAVLHGCKSDPAKRVHCEVNCEADGSVQILVRDPGEGFDPGSVASPLSDENVRADHGRGVYLIRQLMDEVEYANGGREIRMKKS